MWFSEGLNLIPRVLRLIGQRFVARRDSGELECAVPENIHTPTTEVFFYFNPPPLGISVSEGLWRPSPPPPHPSGISGFLKPSSLNPSEVQNPFRLRKLTTHTIMINFFIIEAMSPTLVQLFNNTSLFYLFILLLKLYPEKIEKKLQNGHFFASTKHGLILCCCVVYIYNFLERLRNYLYHVTTFIFHLHVKTTALTNSIFLMISAEKHLWIYREETAMSISCTSNIRCCILIYQVEFEELWKPSRKLKGLGSPLISKLQTILVRGFTSRHLIVISVLIFWMKWIWERKQVCVFNILCQVFIK